MIWKHTLHTWCGHAEGKGLCGDQAAMSNQPPLSTNTAYQDGSIIVQDPRSPMLGICIYLAFYLQVCLHKKGHNLQLINIEKEAY